MLRQYTKDEKKGEVERLSCSELKWKGRVNGNCNGIRS